MPSLKRLNRTAVIFAVIGSSVISAAAEVTLTEVTPEQVVFQWELTGYQLVTEMQNGSRATRVLCPDANSELKIADGWAVPGYTFHVGLPPGGRATATLTVLETETARASDPLVRAAAEDAAVRLAQPNLSVAEMARFGRLQAARFRLVPFVYDGGSVRVLKRARVTVTVHGNTAYAGGIARPTHFDPILRRTMLNYEAARAWRAPGPSVALRKSQRAAYPVPGRGEVLAFTIGDGHNGLNEGTTEENGLVRIAGSDVAAVLGSGIDMDKVALLAAVKGELLSDVPDESEGAPLRLVRIPLLRVDTDGDGRLDGSDSFVAWVTGGCDWRFNEASSTFGYQLNPYDDYRRYWLVYDADNALTMDTAGLSGLVAQRTVDHFTDRLYVKRSRIKPSDGRTATLSWAWEKLTSANHTGTYTLPVVDPDPDSTGRLLVAFKTVKGTDDFSMSFGGESVCSGCSRSQWYDVDSWQDNTVEIRYYGGASTESCAEVEHFELEYSRRLDMNGRDRMTVFSPCLLYTLRAH
ncbi:MAG: hypothetical protein GF331_23395, partial [Chitinivibrionales bacterium]|nr:hypothetical protein [Chitinivibrionales bacterium]